MLHARDAFSSQNNFDPKAYNVVTAVYRSREQMREAEETGRLCNGEKLTHRDMQEISERARAVYIVWPSDSDQPHIEMEKHIFETHYDARGSKYLDQYLLKEGMTAPVSHLSQGDSTDEKLSMVAA